MGIASLLAKIVGLNASDVGQSSVRGRINEALCNRMELGDKRESLIPHTPLHLANVWKAGSNESGTAGKVGTESRVFLILHNGFRLHRLALHESLSGACECQVSSIHR